MPIDTSGVVFPYSDVGPHSKCAVVEAPFGLTAPTNLAEFGVRSWSCRTVTVGNGASGAVVNV